MKALNYYYQNCYLLLLFSKFSNLITFVIINNDWYHKYSLMSVNSQLLNQLHIELDAYILQFLNIYLKISMSYVNIIKMKLINIISVELIGRWTQIDIKYGNVTYFCRLILKIEHLRKYNRKTSDQNKSETVGNI